MPALDPILPDDGEGTLLALQRATPFIVWPDYKGGYVILDHRTAGCVTGAFNTVESAFAEMDRLNAEHTCGTLNPEHANGIARSRRSDCD